MFDPIDASLQYCHCLNPDDHAVKVISLVPVVNHIFFQIKSEQLSGRDEKALKDFGWYLYGGFCLQVFIYAKPLANYLFNCSFRERYNIFVNLTVYMIASDAHLKTLTPN
ncbi:MAG: hypothetical protein KDK64_07460 [Chlamydiia bacterium]|nr:hypothetical protein [Chlamydiia bacterium]